MPIKVGINGFGRMGRLFLRAAWSQKEIEIIHVNEIKGDVCALSHLLKFDSVYGRWDRDVKFFDNFLIIDGHKISCSKNLKIESTNWKEIGVDVVIECTGKLIDLNELQKYIIGGVKKVVVTAPVKNGALNIVMGVNDSVYDGSQNIITAASCTTNCLAPIVKVLHEKIGIKHGMISTIHNMTNTQGTVDAIHKDLRRARSAALSLIPTTTGSATAIALIFPELRGKLDGIAIRVPLLNSSLTDCTFELEKPTSVEQVNDILKEAADGDLKGILGYEDLPLVSIDFKGDPRSAIVDALSTKVTNGTQVKILAWYDNEWGYINRTVELAIKIAKSIQ